MVCVLLGLQTISARRWKLDMGLNGKGKDGSRELAVQLFPQSADLLKCVCSPASKIARELSAAAGTTKSDTPS